MAVVARTNNVLEQFFARAKQSLRRRVGRAHLSRDMQDQPAQVALVANLRPPDYVRLLCGSLPELPLAFARLERQPASRPSPLQRDVTIPMPPCGDAIGSGPHKLPRVRPRRTPTPAA